MTDMTEKKSMRPVADYHDQIRTQAFYPSQPQATMILRFHIVAISARMLHATQSFSKCMHATRAYCKVDRIRQVMNWYLSSPFSTQTSPFLASSSSMVPGHEKPVRDELF
jgi:hypothetical protein